MQSYYHVGDTDPFITPLGPSIEGMGFLRAFVGFIRGTPWFTLGSRIRVGSSFAGTIQLINKEFSGRKH
jgi:hypothetical protein